MSPTELETCIRRMIALGAPKVWILLILLASWIRLPEDCDIQSGYQVIELFAGKKRISKLAKSIGLVTCAHDIMYDKNFNPKKKSVHPSKSCMDINEPAGFLLCIITILRGRFNDLICMMGILCSTWTVVNAGTSCRDLLTPMGQQDYPSVASGNRMVSRAVLLWLLLICMGAVPILEQPSSSIMNYHDRFQWLFQLLRKYGIAVYRTSFWMAHFKHPTSKRSSAWSTCWPICHLNRGKLNRKSFKKEYETAVRYVDGSGKQRWKGSSKLKGTQDYTPRFASTILRLRPTLLAAAPKCPAVDEKTPLVELFASLSYDDMWDDAALRDCIYYTRGSHVLEIPGQWRPVLPNSI